MTKAILLGVMTAFVGTKSVLATPMTRGEYNEYRGWQIPENEDPNEQGYLIEYVDGGSLTTNAMQAISRGRLQMYLSAAINHLSLIQI